MHLQQDEILGSSTLPFHLVDTNIKKYDQSSFKYALSILPNEGDTINAVKVHAKLHKALNLTVGKKLDFNVSVNGQQAKQRQLEIKLDISGRFFIESDSGASSYFIEQGGVLAFYGRNNKSDQFLDMWLLALGLTPMNLDELKWQDAANEKLFPLTKVQKYVLRLFRIFGKGLSSQYQRKKNGGWNQEGVHQIKLFFRKKAIATTLVKIMPDYGCTEIRLKSRNLIISAYLTRQIYISDQGIPESFQIKQLAKQEI
jgi:hypothetical protein